MKWLAGILVAAVIGGIVWAVVAQNRWEHRCREAHGRIEQRFEGYITTYTYIYDSKGNAIGIIPHQTPNYSYHCWVDGREVSV